MKEQDLIQTLKKMQRISPDTGYARTSLAQILRTNQSSNWIFGNALVKMAVGISAMALVVVVSVLQVAGPSDAKMASLDDASLIAELDSKDFQIELKEAHYFNQSAERVAMALDEVVEYPEKN